MNASPSLLSSKDLISHSIQVPSQWYAKVSFSISQGPYTIKIADTDLEFQDVIALRQEVFLREFAQEDLSLESDVDPLDGLADFLIIKRKDKVIASYRLLCSKFTDQFYSATEFKADGFFAALDTKLELSRACVERQARSSIALHLLWRGLAEYMLRTQARYLFGCSSVQSLDLKKIIKVYKQLKEMNAISQEFDIAPKNQYHFVTAHKLNQDFDIDLRENSDLIPPLLWGYIKAGAKVFGAPAVDLRFACVDFFTILDFNQISSAYYKKYIRCPIQ